ncbi:MAG: hypothetical protein O3B97_01005 [Actinomycetota bacterium]|nr:hypothetical protein [Actinomycetota bacterium]
MRVPPWARWAVAVVVVLGIAAAGVAANMKVLGSTNDDTRLGTLSAKSLAVASGQAPPVRVVTDDDDDDKKDDDEDDHDRREDDSDDD